MSKGGSSAPSNQTVTQRIEIPAFLRPFLGTSAAISRNTLRDLRDQLRGATADDLVAPFSPDQQRAIELTRDVAGGAGGFVPTFQDQLLSTARGDFLFGGPGFNEAVEAAVRAAQPGILSSFSGAGRGNSGLVQAAIAEQATDAFARQFGSERARQQAALAALPTAATLPASLLSGIGGLQQAQAQRELSAPIDATQRIFSAAGGGLPTASLLGSTQSATGPGSNPFAGALGGGALGLGLGSLLNPPTAAGLAGGGLGAFSSLGPLGLGAFALGGGLLGGLLS